MQVGLSKWISIDQSIKRAGSLLLIRRDITILQSPFLIRRHFSRRGKDYYWNLLPESSKASLAHPQATCPNFYICIFMFFLTDIITSQIDVITLFVNLTLHSIQIFLWTDEISLTNHFFTLSCRINYKFCYSELITYLFLIVLIIYLYFSLSTHPKNARPVVFI